MSTLSDLVDAIVALEPRELGNLCAVFEGMQPMGPEDRRWRVRLILEGLLRMPKSDAALSRGLTEARAREQHHDG